MSVWKNYTGRAKSETRRGSVHFPQTNGPVARRGQEAVLEERRPGDLVNGTRVASVRLQVLFVVGCRAAVNVAIFGAAQISYKDNNNNKKLKFKSIGFRIFKPYYLKIEFISVLHRFVLFPKIEAQTTSMSRYQPIAFTLTRLRLVLGFTARLLLLSGSCSGRRRSPIGTRAADSL